METKIASHYDLPYPPTVNHYWRRVGDRTLISRAGRRYRDRVWAALQTQGVVRLEGRLSLRITVYAPDRRKRDLDNILKALLDALSPSLYGDDSQIDDLHIERGEVVRGGLIVVEIEPWNSVGTKERP